MPVYSLGDRTPKIHPNAYLHPSAVIIGDVTIGPEASVWPCAVLRGDYGRIEIGARTSVQDGSVIHATEEFSTTVGSDCVIGHLVHLEGCTVEDECLIGPSPRICGGQRGLDRRPGSSEWRAGPRRAGSHRGGEGACK